ncbi:MAG TPA: VWA domain-containing protein, partial [Negativicutes bacterium]
YRTTGKHKTVDLRQSIRRNMRYGGMMLSLKHKTKKIHKPKMVVLCDVSASMAKYVRFTLPLLFGMSKVVKHIESFIFADDLEEATDYFQRGQDFNKATNELLSETVQMGQGTNIAIALNSLRKKYHHLLTPSTMLIIVSDARTLSPLEAGAQLADIEQKVKKILWLNTQSAERWEENNAIPIFQRYCDMVECYSLVHLLRILKKNFATSA